MPARSVGAATPSDEHRIAELRESFERSVVGHEFLRGGAEKGEAGGELEGVDAAAHQLFERAAAGELVADGGGDFFVAGAEERVAQVALSS